MGILSRRKGAQAEREVAVILRQWFPEAHRRASGEESQDEQGRDLDGVPQACIQVHHGSRSIQQKYREAVAASGTSDRIAVAVTKRNRGEWLATVSLEDFGTLMAAFHRR